MKPDIADFMIFLGTVLLVAGVAFYDWRAGLIVFGVLLVAAGALRLRGTTP